MIGRKSLVIVESPAKAKTINRYLGSGYIVKSSLGHIKDLPLRSLGVDITNGFEPQYELVKDKVPVIKELRSLSKRSERIYLATDPDREGEAICWHLFQELGRPREQVLRVLFTEITKEGIKAGMSNPTSIDLNKVNAQQARRVLDRLVGYQISPLLSHKVRKGLSAGRVQSVALRLICEREMAIRSFVPEEYWTITAVFQTEDGREFKAELYQVRNKKVKITDGGKAEEIAEQLRDAEFSVSSVEKKPKTQKPPPPFITSTLQQAASSELRIPARVTMELAQSLYEGVDLGEKGLVGLITYMRTDSTRVSETALRSVRKLIESKYGSEFVPRRPNVFKSPKAAQEAHEAIRPTDVSLTPESVKEFLSRDQFRLYRLIWAGFVASQMKPAVFEKTTVKIKSGDFTFRAEGSVTKFPGFLKALEQLNHHRRNQKDVQLPPLKVGQTLCLKKLDKKQHFTEPPPRFTESTLIKALVENGIGRPSTYATILSTIRMREYVQMEKRAFKPTPLGLLVNQLLIANFPQVMDIGFTAEMEKKLDMVEEGKLDWKQAVSRFYEGFAEQLKNAERNMSVPVQETQYRCEACGSKMVLKWSRKKGWFLSCSAYPKCKTAKDVVYDTLGNLKVIEPKKSKIFCEKCGKEMVLKQSRYGSFLACSGYPECRNTKPVRLDNQTGEMTVIETEKVDEKCPVCGADMVVKLGKSGRFLACSAYPKCTFTKSISIGVDCPRDGCGGYITERRTRKGRVFYGCSNYPNCDFAVWDKPIPERCPQCGGLMVIKYEKGSEQPSFCCIAKGCGFKTKTKEALK